MNKLVDPQKLSPTGKRFALLLMRVLMRVLTGWWPEKIIDQDDVLYTCGGRDDGFNVWMTKEFADDFKAHAWLLEMICKHIMK